MNFIHLAARVASTPSDPILERLRSLAAVVEVSDMGVVTLYATSQGERRDVTREFPRAFGFWVKDPKTTPAYFSSQNAKELKKDFVSHHSAKNLVIEIGGKRYRPGSRPGVWDV